MTARYQRHRLSVVAPPEADGFTVGTVLQDTYRIVRQLAEGGFGEVYQAAHTRLPATFAVKLLHRSLARNAEALARFRQEAEITSTLRHPHIVKVFDFNVTEAGVPYLVMELLEGQPLSALIASGVPLDPQRATRIVDQIAQALHAAHQAGVVHRDLKPDNIMLLTATGAEDFVKVLDFGISKASWRTRLTQDDTVSGTPQYMAPEQARAQREEVDHRADQFSLAAIAYALLTGREPFRGEEPVAVLYQVVHEDPPRPQEVNPAVGGVADAVVMRGLAKQPGDRYADVLEFSRMLGGAVGSVQAESSAELVDEAPSVRHTAVDGPATAPFELAVVQGGVPGREQEDPPPPGRETRRLIRRVRGRLRRPGRIAALALLAGLCAVAWFHPVTRGPTRAEWHRVEMGLNKLLDRADLPLHLGPRE